MKTKATKPEAFENKFPHFSHNRKYPWNRLESKMNPWCSQRGLAWSHSDKRVIVIVDKMGKKVSLITLHQFCFFHLNDIRICTEGEKLTFSISRKLLPSCIFFLLSRGICKRFSSVKWYNFQQDTTVTKLLLESVRLTCHLSIIDMTGITESFSSQLPMLK